MPSGARGAVLRHILLLQRDVRKAAHFYSEGLGLTVNVCTERWAELQSGGTRLGLKGVDGCAGQTAPGASRNLTAAPSTGRPPCPWATLRFCHLQSQT